MHSCMDYLNSKLVKLLGYPEPAEESGYRFHRNTDGSGDITCIHCGCIHRIDGDKKQLLNSKQVHCKTCGALLNKWVKETA